MTTSDPATGSTSSPSIDNAVQQREALITGKPPRIPALSTDEAIEMARQQTSKLRIAVMGDASPVEVAEIPEMLLALMCHPDLYERVSALSVQLLAKNTLSPRDRELAVLRTGWLCQAPYEWGEHVRIAKLVGITSEQIEQVTVGSSADGWTEHERALLRAVEELHQGAMICDATWDTLARTLDNAQLYELMIVVGQFTMVAYFQNACRFRLSAGNEGLRAR